MGASQEPSEWGLHLANLREKENWEKLGDIL